MGLKDKTWKGFWRIENLDLKCFGNNLKMKIKGLRNYITPCHPIKKGY
jgi:hypothetical protein